MSRVDKTGLLIMGMKEKSESDIFHRDNFHQIPIFTGLQIAFLNSY